MYRAARSVLNHPEDTEDAVQEAVCFACRGDLRDPPRFRPGLLRIVVNTCYETCRKQKKVMNRREKPRAERMGYSGVNF